MSTPRRLRCKLWKTDVIGTYYYATQGLFPELLPNTWFIGKYDSPFSMESYGQENTEQAIAYLDRQEEERRKHSKS